MGRPAHNLLYRAAPLDELGSVLGRVASQELCVGWPPPALSWAAHRRDETVTYELSEDNNGRDKNRCHYEDCARPQRWLRPHFSLKGNMVASYEDLSVVL